MSTKLTLRQFAAQLEYWYQRYTASPYFQRYRNLEAGLSQKAADVGYLEKGDLLWIAIWGGDEKRHQLGSLICNNNSSEDVVRHTKAAIDKLDRPGDALRNLLCISYVGPAYGSKALRCICPQKYAAFDYHVRKACESLLPQMQDRDSELAGYVWFLEICHRLLESVTVLGPRPGGVWYIADVEMAIFQFAFEGGILI